VIARYAKLSALADSEKSLDSVKKEVKMATTVWETAEGNCITNRDMFALETCLRSKNFDARVVGAVVGDITATCSEATRICIKVRHTKYHLDLVDGVTFLALDEILPEDLQLTLEKGLKESGFVEVFSRH
jgi:hypothetical protein